MDPAEIGRKIKTAYPVYKNIPDELLGARVIQKFPSMGVESSLDIRKKELDIEKAERENKPLNPNQYLNITPSPIERPPLESFVVKDTTFQGGQKPFIQKEVKKEVKTEPKKSFLRRVGEFFIPQTIKSYEQALDVWKNPEKYKKNPELIKQAQDQLKKRQPKMALELGSFLVPIGQGAKAAIGAGALIGAMRGASEGEDYDAKKITGSAAGGALMGGVFSGAGSLLKSIFKNVPKRIMSSLLKEPIKAAKAGIKTGTSLGEQALERGEVGTTTSIYKRALDNMVQLEDELQNKLLGSKQKVATKAIRETLNPFIDELKQSGNASAAKTIFDRIALIEKEAGKSIPVARANAIKRTLYDELMKKYGEQGAAGTELTKQLARAFKEQIGKVEGVSQINKDLSYYGRVAKSLLDKMTKDERAATISLTDTIIGAGGLASGYGAPAIGAIAAKKVLSSTPVKTIAAQGLYKTGKLLDRIPTYLTEGIKRTGAFAGAKVGSMFASPSVTPSKQGVQADTNQKPEEPHSINDNVFSEGNQGKMFSQSQSLTGYDPTALNQAYQKAAQSGDKAAADYFQDQFKKEVAFRKAQALPAQVKQKVMEAEAADKLLTTLQGIYENVPAELKAAGPDFGRLQGIKGDVAAFRQTNTSAANYKKQQKAFLSLLTRAAGEKGVLTNQDVARIKEALPSFYDTPDVAAEAWGTIRTIITSAVTNTVEPYSSQYPTFAE